MTAHVSSFGYGHAPAPDAHLTFDVRHLFRDPHVSPRLRQLTGRHPDVINNGYVQACVSEGSARGRVRLYKDGVLINREVSRTEWRTVDSESSEDRRADASKPVVTCDNGSRKRG